MDFDSYKELIELVQKAPVKVLLTFTPRVTDDTSNEEYPVMVVTNVDDAALVSAMTAALSVAPSYNED